MKAQTGKKPHRTPRVRMLRIAAAAALMIGGSGSASAMMDPEGYQLCQINWVAHVVSQGKFCIKVPDSLCGWGAQWEGDTFYTGGIWWIGPTCQDPNLNDPPEDPVAPEEDADQGDPEFCPIGSASE